MLLTLIQSKIYEVRDQSVMLDFDLAEMYEVETKRLKESVKRNKRRFPTDFMFTLTQKEFQGLRSQFATSKRGGTRYLPYAFTEQGVSMLSTVLNSEKAIAVNLTIMRTFVLVRRHALNFQDLQSKLLQLEEKHDKNFGQIYHALNLLINSKAQQDEQAAREPIGFKTKSIKSA